MKRAVYALTTLLTIALVAPAFAVHEGDKGPRPDHKPPQAIPLLPKRAAERLDLTADQKEKIDKINKKFNEERDAWLAKNKPEENLRAKIRDAEKAGDEAKAKALKEEVKAKMKPVWELRQSYMKQVRAELTPEQITKLDEMRDEAREHRKERKKPAPGPDHDDDHDHPEAE